MQVIIKRKKCVNCALDNKCKKDKKLKFVLYMCIPKHIAKIIHLQPSEPLASPQ